jgi:hypothetical protein
MKLSDIFEAVAKPTSYVPIKAIPIMHNDIRKVRDLVGHEHVGSGMSAYVYKNNNSDELNQVSRLSAKADPTSKYLMLIHGNAELQNNPFLPRVREIKNPSKKTVDIQMERLYPMLTPLLVDDEDQLMLQAVWDRYLAAPYPIGFGRDAITPKDVIIALVNKIHTAVLENHYRYIKDSDLVLALKFIREFMLKHSGHPDIHYKNVMWRITGSMPQLVITDPLSD